MTRVLSLVLALLLNACGAEAEPWVPLGDTHSLRAHFGGRTRRLTVQFNPALQNLELPALTTVSGRFFVISNDALTTLSAPLLAALPGEMRLGNRVLGALSLPSLASAGVMILQGNGGAQGLTSVNLPALTTVALLSIHDNGALTALSIPALRTVSGGFTIASNQQLRQCLVDALRNQLTSPPARSSTSGNNGLPNTCP